MLSSVRNLAGGCVVALVVGGMLTVFAPPAMARDFYVSCSVLNGKAKSTCTVYCNACSSAEQGHRDCDALLQEFRLAVASPDAFPSCR